MDAIGADAARASVGGSRVCTTLLAGPPAGSIAADGLHRQVLVNRSDPVADWSPALIWRPTRPTHQRVDTGTALRRPQWIPVASFISRSIDLLSARSFGSGVGHRYGPEQAQIREQCLDHTAIRRDPR